MITSFVSLRFHPPRLWDRSSRAPESPTNALLTGLDLGVDVVGRKTAEPGQKIFNQTFELQFRIRLISDLYGLASHG
jgi:hypothetical protein